MIRRVRVKKCCVDIWWYHDKIGLEYDINTSYRVGNAYPGHVLADTPHNRAMGLKEPNFNNNYIASKDYEFVEISDNEMAVTYLQKWEDFR